MSSDRRLALSIDPAASTNPSRNASVSFRALPKFNNYSSGVAGDVDIGRHWD
jgi:hypothetical protein